MSRTFTMDEVSGHSTAEQLYLVVDKKVYDVTKFQHEHPGGDEFLLDQGGQDVTELFEDAGHSDEARRILKTLAIGAVQGKNFSPAVHPDEKPRKEAWGLGIVYIFIAVLCAILGCVLYMNASSVSILQ